MPLGIALSGSSLLRTFLFGLSLSTSAEVLQMGYVDRIPSGFDVASNTIGALVGYLVAMVWLRATGGRSEIAADSAARRGNREFRLRYSASIMLVDHPTRSDFSNWSPSFHLAIGNELTGNRPWAGTISEFQIYPFAMAPSQIDDLAHQAAHADNTAFPRGGLVPPANSQTPYGRPLLSSDEELSFHDALVSHNQLTLLVALRTEQPRSEWSRAHHHLFSRSRRTETLPWARSTTRSHSVCGRPPLARTGPTPRCTPDLFSRPTAQRLWRQSTTDVFPGCTWMAN